MRRSARRRFITGARRGLGHGIASALHKLGQAHDRFNAELLAFAASL
jgi:NAD(P)-dependent dehydrogenase (short-subunit alcohol dehydrogenase family)